jgi:hypothetical protein
MHEIHLYRVCKPCLWPNFKWPLLPPMVVITLARAFKRGGSIQLKSALRQVNFIAIESTAVWVEKHIFLSLILQTGNNNFPNFHGYFVKVPFIRCESVVLWGRFAHICTCFNQNYGRVASSLKLYRSVCIYGNELHRCCNKLKEYICGIQSQ